MGLDLHRLLAELRACSGRWNAGTTLVWKRASHERHQLLGHSTQNADLVRRRSADARHARSARRDLSPLDRLDLRAVTGFTTPIRNTTNGAACVNTTWTVVESALRISLARTGLEVSDPRLELCRDRPLLAGSFAVRGSDKRAHIDHWRELSSPELMKAWLAQHGPLLALFAVCEDFYAYVNGVYHHVTGDVDGAHCVAIVGFDNGGEYWIAQNCWGAGWGESGCFRIAFGECGIDASMWGVDVRLEIPSRN